LLWSFVKQRVTNNFDWLSD